MISNRRIRLTKACTRLAKRRPAGDAQVVSPDVLGQVLVEGQTPQATGLGP